MLAKPNNSQNFTGDSDTAGINAVCPASLLNFGFLPGTFSQELMRAFRLSAQHPLVKIHLSSMERQAGQTHCQWDGPHPSHYKSLDH